MHDELTAFTAVAAFRGDDQMTVDIILPSLSFEKYRHCFSDLSAFAAPRLRHVRGGLDHSLTLIAPTSSTAVYTAVYLATSLKQHPETEEWYILLYAVMRVYYQVPRVEVKR